MKITKRAQNYFKNKRLVITGGGGGLGMALSRALEAYCEHIYLLDVHFDDFLSSPNITYLRCDITDEQQVIEQLSSLTKVDVLINNAGVTHMSRTRETSNKTIRQTLDINLMGAIYVTQALLPTLLENNGHIVAISSVAGYTPLYGRSAYAASKHGLEAYCLSLYSEYSDILSTTIVRPAFIKTQPGKKAQTNAGTISPGAQKKQSGGKELDPKAAATKIINGLCKKPVYIHVGTLAIVAKWLFILVPSLYMKLMRKHSRKEFS